jgi:hypothetical protein
MTDPVQNVEKKSEGKEKSESDQTQIYSQGRIVNGDLSESLLREMLEVERYRLDVERGRINSGNQRTDIIRRAIDANDAADKR